MRSLEARTTLVEQFVAARTQLAEGKVADAMAQCETITKITKITKNNQKLK